MPAVLTVVLAQLSPRLRQTKANIETIRRVIAEHPEADLVVFPELFLSGYTLSDIDELAVHLDGPELKMVADMARESSTGEKRATPSSQATSCSSWSAAG